ncbi:DUF6207 family protein [Streptomyces sp. NPDC056452]|uniref:DUF6207 family protein n=1 Tax=Streptomyces sp. NPDC056452 TaxID=3345821 RepID=UPI00368FFBE7
MEPIDTQHISEPGLVVLDITAADESTALAAMASLEQHWATSGVGRARSTRTRRTWCQGTHLRRHPSPSRGVRVMQPLLGARCVPARAPRVSGAVRSYGAGV